MIGSNQYAKGTQPQGRVPLAFRGPGFSPFSPGGILRDVCESVEGVAGGGMRNKMSKHKPGFAYGFYVSNEWRKCREDFLRAFPLCQRCEKKGKAEPARQVHHKIRLTPENIRDPNVALNWANLEALCEDCHREEHKPAARWRCDAMGHVDLGD